MIGYSQRLLIRGDSVETRRGVYGSGRIDAVVDSRNALVVLIVVLKSVLVLLLHH